MHQLSSELGADLPVARLLAQKILGGVFHRTEPFVMVNKVCEQSHLLQTGQAKINIRVIKTPSLMHAEQKRRK